MESPPTKRPHSVNDHPFYRPLWRRVAIIAVTAVWLGVEALYARDPFWSVISAGVFAYAVWAFVIAYKPTNDT